MMISVFWIVFICLEQKTKLNHLVGENKNCCGVRIPSEENMLL